MSDHPEAEGGRWSDRATTEYSLRQEHGTVLMTRWADADGLDYDGSEVPWRDIAVFPNLTDAHNVLRKLRRV